ncbi:hypothetical protein C8J57DRAFT_1291725 [Mycena rebaudengoi]|nr:hypothetical protein C8J57DRAFT_1291725 [Mycena rebaudengoi]
MIRAATVPPTGILEFNLVNAVTTLKLQVLQPEQPCYCPSCTESIHAGERGVGDKQSQPTHVLALPQHHSQRSSGRSTLHNHFPAEWSPTPWTMYIKHYWTVRLVRPYLPSCISVTALKVPAMRRTHRQGCLGCKSMHQYLRHSIRIYCPARAYHKILVEVIYFCAISAKGKCLHT